MNAITYDLAAPRRYTERVVADRYGVSVRTLHRWRTSGWRPGQPCPTGPDAHARRALAVMGRDVWCGASLGRALGVSARSGRRALRALIDADLVEPVGWTACGTPTWRAVSR